jgi:hypothetical protein
MNTTVLLEKLIDIERFVGVAPDGEIRRKVIDIEEYVLRMQSESADGLREAIPALPGRGHPSQMKRGQTSASEDQQMAGAGPEPARRSSIPQEHTFVSYLSQFPSTASPAPIRIDQAHGVPRRRVLSIER